MNPNDATDFLTPLGFAAILAVAAVGYIVVWAARWARESRRLDRDLAGLNAQIDQERRDAA